MDIAGHRRARARRAQPGGAARRRRRARAVRGAAARRRAGRSAAGSARRRARGSTRRIRADEILTLDPATMDYRPQQPRASAVARRGAQRSSDVGERIRTLFLGAGQGRPASCATRSGRRSLYAARVDAATSRIRSTTSIARCDGASAGSWPVRDVGCDRRRTTCSTRCGATDLPPLVAEALARGAFRPAAAGGAVSLVPPASPTSRSCARRSGGAIVRRNAGAQPGRSRRRRARVEFHSKMNAIGGDTIEMLQAGVREAAAQLPRRSSSATRRRTSPPAPT